MTRITEGRLTLILGKHFTPSSILPEDMGRRDGVLLVTFPEAGLHPSKVQIPISGRCYTHAEFVIQEVGIQIACGKRAADQAVVEVHGEDGTVTVCNYDEEGVLQNWPIGYFSREEK